MLLHDVDEIVQNLESPGQFDGPPFRQTFEDRVAVGQLVAAFARVNALHGEGQERLFGPNDRSLQAEVGPRAVENPHGHGQRILGGLGQVFFQQVTEGEGGRKC